MAKTPRHAYEPKVAKEAKSSAPGFHAGRPLAWRFSHADRGGAWPWNDDVPVETFRKLADFESLTLSDLIRGGNFSVGLEQLAKSARDRLVVIQLDDQDSLYHFRLQGKTRVWCVREENVMRVIWYDPEHEVCPSPKKYT